MIADRSNERLRIDDGFQGSSNTTYLFLTTASLIDQREQFAVLGVVID